MKLLKTLTISLCLFLSTFVWAAAPLHYMVMPCISDTGKVQDDPTIATSKKDKSDHIRTRPDDAPHLFKRPQIGIIAGFNFTSNNGSTSTATPPFLYNPEVGPMAGFTFTFPIGSFLGIRLEALYSQDAFTDETLIGLSTYIYYNRLSYIDVPIMLQIKPFRKLTFFGGADYQYLVRNVYQYVDSPVSPSVQQECQNHTPKNYFPGILYGVSYQVYRITVGARVTMNVPNNYALDQQNAVLFQLSLGYTFFSRYR